MRAIVLTMIALGLALAPVAAAEAGPGDDRGYGCLTVNTDGTFYIHTYTCKRAVDMTVYMVMALLEGGDGDQ